MVDRPFFNPVRSGAVISGKGFGDCAWYPLLLLHGPCRATKEADIPDPAKNPTVDPFGRVLTVLYLHFRWCCSFCTKLYVKICRPETLQSAVGHLMPRIRLPCAETAISGQFVRHLRVAHGPRERRGPFPGCWLLLSLDSPSDQFY